MLSQTNPENNQANVNYPHEKWRGKHSEGWQQLKTASTEGKTQTNQTPIAITNISRFYSKLKQIFKRLAWKIKDITTNKYQLHTALPVVEKVKY